MPGGGPHGAVHAQRKTWVWGSASGFKGPRQNNFVCCGRRGARRARREEKSYWGYAADEQRWQAGWIGAHGGSYFGAGPKCMPPTTTRPGGMDRQPWTKLFLRGPETEAATAMELLVEGDAVECRGGREALRLLDRVCAMTRRLVHPCLAARGGRGARLGRPPLHPGGGPIPGARIWYMIAMSPSLPNPRQMVVAPGSPSLLRPRKPPSLAINRTASRRPMGLSGGGLR